MGLEADFVESEGTAPVPIAVIDVDRCQPERCGQGICLARRNCAVKTLWQESPFEVPFLSGGRCNGCAKCVATCPLKAFCMS